MKRRPGVTLYEADKQGNPASNFAATLAAVTCALLTACGSSTAPNHLSASTERYPVTVENCGERITFEGPPTHVATNDINTAEDMIALGLERSIAGTFAVAGDEPGPIGEAVPARYLRALRSTHEISPEDFTVASISRLHPDLLFAGWWNYGLNAGTNTTPGILAKQGIKTLALSESCAQVQHSKRSASIDDTYRDLRNLGAIFDVRSRAQAVVDRMKAEIAAVRAKVAGLQRLSVFLYENDPGDPVTALGLGTPTALIALAGGQNVFASVKRTWTAVSWKEIAARKPQCIVIDDYATPTWREKETLLKNHARMRDVPAVRDNCFLHLSYDQLAPGPRNGEAVAALARRLHPQAFASPSA